MKVKCINKEDWAKITIDKTYDVISRDIHIGCNYSIINDTGYIGWYPEEWFKLLSEYRIKRIDKLLK